MCVLSLRSKISVGQTNSAHWPNDSNVKASISHREITGKTYAYSPHVFEPN